MESPELIGDKWSVHDLTIQDLRNILNLILMCKINKKSKEYCKSLVDKKTITKWPEDMIDKYW